MHMARGHHLGPHIDHAAEHTLRPDLAPERVVGIEQRQPPTLVRPAESVEEPPGKTIGSDHQPAARREHPGEGRRGGRQCLAFQRRNDEVGLAESGCVVRGREFYGQVLVRRRETETRASDRVEMRAAGHDGDILARRGQPDRKNAADRTGAEDHDAHAFRPQLLGQYGT